MAKIVVISMSVGVFVVFIIFDVFLWWYCHKKIDKDEVLQDIEIGGVRKADLL